jgi:hypothetical protein
MTPQTETIYNQLVTADYDQLFGQAKRGLIPLQSSILLNPQWFLKEVAARLQRNEDEASSDEESFVSITEVPYADLNISRRIRSARSEIYKAHKSDSDPLEPRVTRSKFR